MITSDPVVPICLPNSSWKQMKGIVHGMLHALRWTPVHFTIQILDILAFLRLRLHVFQPGTAKRPYDVYIAPSWQLTPHQQEIWFFGPLAATAGNCVLRNEVRLAQCWLGQLDDSMPFAATQMAYYPIPVTSARFVDSLQRDCSRVPLLYYNEPVFEQQRLLCTP
jgi:hypothetical protein